MTRFKVSGDCWDEPGCPLYSELHGCSHCAATGFTISAGMTERPDWCPLRAGPVTVELEEGEEP